MLRYLSLAAVLLATVILPATAQTPVPSDSAFAAAIEGATALGEGPAQLYDKDGRTLLALPPAAFDRLLLWYAEAARMPAELVAYGGNAIGELVVKLERRGPRVYVRDLTSAASKRAVVSPTDAPSVPGTPTEPMPAEPRPAEPRPAEREVPGSRSDPKVAPIELAVSDATLGALILALEIKAERTDGAVLVDLTPAFAGDIGAHSAMPTVRGAGFTPILVDPARSYIERARSYPENISIRSHLTFQDAGGRALSIVVGHSLVLLPETPMAGRSFDDRVGFFKTGYVAFEGGNVVEREELILRHRLEKRDPAAEVSAPVEPLVYYVGQGVPERWRPYVEAGIEAWQPVFEAAGFTNAIVAREAPTPEEDPFWSPEDVRFNVIRWLPQEMANAMGPVIYDPRSGEIISAHVILWPSVLPFFSTYYFALHNTVDPEAATYPLSEEKLGELLTYVVAHEVGHTLGLRHNHLASTAYTTEQLRDPSFANENGPNTSIMAYGRFNQAAQPGDGVTQFYPVMGPWDYFAIGWGYRTFPERSAAEEEAALDALAAEAAADRMTMWAAGEYPDEFRQAFDPRVQTENTGADRVEATRLSARRFAGMLERLPEATGGDRELIRSVYDQALTRYMAHLRSVHKLVGGVYDAQLPLRRYRPVPADEQRRAVEFLMTEAPASLAMFEAPDLTAALEPAGTLRTLDGYRETLVHLLLTGPRLAILDEQHRRHPAAYGVVAFADDLLAALFDNLSASPSEQRVMQAAFIEAAAPIVQAARDRKWATTLIAVLFDSDPDQLEIGNAKGSDTAFPAWARDTFPNLRDRLEAAAAATSDASLRYHQKDLARRINQILNAEPRNAGRSGSGG